MTEEINKSNTVKEEDWIRTREQILEFLEANGGYLSHTATALDISRKTLWTYIRSSPELQEEIEHLNEARLDMTELALMKNVDGGNITAQMYHLNCKGRHRGFGNFKQIEITNDSSKDEPVPEEYL